MGRGPSTLTVQAPQTQTAAGNSVVIQGIVVDISAGTQQDEQSARFPAGVPVTSDASMKDWMGYVYQQKPLPSSFTGVSVSIDAIDPNGNIIHIGSATTNTKGFFSYAWQTPDVPGKYDVTATFAGTNGYWPSSSETAMVVSAAAATPAPSAAPVQSTADLYFVPAVAAIIVIVIVGFAVLFLALRKHP